MWESQDRGSSVDEAQSTNSDDVLQMLIKEAFYLLSSSMNAVETNETDNASSFTNAVDEDCE